MNIGILGGSFDPPTLAHLQMVLFALASGKVDQVWMFPCWKHAFGKEPAKFEDRDAMCRLAVHAVFDVYQVKVKPFEAIWQINYTVDLIERLKIASPDDTFTLIIGADNLRDAAKWHRWDDILKMTQPPIVIGRPGVEITGTVFEGSPISSTMVRDAIKRGDYAACESLVPAAVLDYIREYRLYR